MRVLIVGAGLAGNALAFWLSKIGHEVTVIERFPTLRSTGLQVDLRGHGVDVMRKMGIEKAYREKKINEKGIQIVGSSGKRWGFFPVNNTGTGLQSFSTQHEILRGDLCRLLYEATEQRVTYMFGTSIKELTQAKDSVEVCFTDQTKQNFDLVVGADGQGSLTRKEMFKPDTEEKRTFAKLSIAYFTIPRKILPGEDYIATIYTAPGTRVVMTRRHVPDAKQVYLFCDASREEMKNVRGRSMQEQKEAFASVFRDAGWEMQEITDTMLRHSDDFYCEREAYVTLDSWSQGRVALCGDACWASASSTGMGTTSAIVGAYVLAGEIARHCEDGKTESLAVALKSYEKTFQPFMKQVQKDLGKPGVWFPSSSIGIALVNVLWGVLSLLGVNVFGRILKEDIVDWELPEYEELLGEKTSA